MAGAMMVYFFVLLGTTFPTHQIPMDSPQACQQAVQSFLASSFVQGIQNAGGTVTAYCQ